VRNARAPHLTRPRSINVPGVEDDRVVTVLQYFLLDDVMRRRVNAFCELTLVCLLCDIGTDGGIH
jgi:hypothetical protein